MSRTDTAQLGALRTEVLVWRALETAVREPVAVYAPPASGGMFNVRVALRQRVPGEARNAIAAVFASLANVKNVFVVDPDIDIFSDAQMEWALATRFQPDRDLVVASGLRTMPLDPSLGTARAPAPRPASTSPGRSARRRDLKPSVPEPPTYEGRRFPSVRAALADGPKYLRGADGRARQQRRARGGAGARRAARRRACSGATKTAATGCAPRPGLRQPRPRRLIPRRRDVGDHRQEADRQPVEFIRSVRHVGIEEKESPGSR